MSPNSGHWIASSLRSSQRRSQKSYRTEQILNGLLLNACLDRELTCCL
ncbi:hypothetical protein SC438_15420 [Legionella pneumophila]|nr:hypothetical protein [Legionella pneumophila]MDW9181065.1 hypothetical protein [Legionella pneumophila]